VVFTRAIHLPGLADWKVLSELPMFAPMRETGSCEEGSFDAEVVEELKIGPNDLLFNKSRYSPFVETDIETKLRALGVENLIVGGVGTSVCVESSVRDAAQREFRTFVVEEAVGDISAASNQSSLHMMGTMFGWTVSVDDVVAAWS
jgi:ureidoacrylate peracid hydrolase